MRAWGHHFRCGRHYNRRDILIWHGLGWGGCARYSRHLWRLWA